MLELRPSLVQDGSILDVKEAAPLSLVDAVIHESLSHRPSQTRPEPSGEGEGPGGGATVGKTDGTSESAWSCFLALSQQSLTHAHTLTHTHTYMHTHTHTHTHTLR